MGKRSSRNRYSVLSNCMFAVAWQFKIAPGYTLYSFIYAIYGDVVALLEHAFLIPYIISCVENKRPFSDILVFFIPILVAGLIKITLDCAMTNYVGVKVENRTKEAIQMKLYKKAAEMDISKYDDSGFYNDFVWAMQKAPEHVTAVTNTLRRLVSMIALIFIAGTYIVSTDPLAIIVVLFIMVFTLWAQKIINQRKIKREEELMPVSRKRDYVNRVFYLIDYVKDIKTSTISEKLRKDFKTSSEDMEKLVKKHGFGICRMAILRDAADYILYDGGYLTYLFYQALVKKKFGLGSLLALYNAANWLSNNLRKIIMIMPQFQEHSLYITKLRTFLDAENTMPDTGTLAVPDQGEIVLEDVHFTYPGNTEPTLNGVSLKIKQGEKIALVGFNGAGKSTLIKLLLRLYDPDKGTVRLAGNSAKEYPMEEYRHHFGALFQDFEIIATDISHNLTMCDQEADVELAETVLKKAAFWDRFQTLPDGLETRLTREFDDRGINLSGGEAQKLALARVLYADSSVIVLDEPSSALDPIAEYELNKTVTELAGNKTVIIISHRLSTTRFVDRIYMLENGRIVEQGNHDSLLAQNGQYAKMFRLQAEKYR